MIIDLINNDFRFDISNIVLLFFPRIDTNDATDGKTLTVSLNESYANATLLDNNKVFNHKVEMDSSLYEFERYACDRAVFEVCFADTGLRPPWGLLVGVRPINFYTKLKSIYGNKTNEILEKYYLVSPDKIKLCSDILSIRQPYLNKLKQNSFSLYVSIPFCPSRCKYCSFVSFSTEKETKYIDKYVDILCEEIQKTSVRLRGQSPLTIYIGGGTPSCIPDYLFENVVKCITNSYDLSECFEFTVEAGRPETVTENKLQIMKRYGVNRICINPQSLSEIVLNFARRKHSIDDFFNAYALASDYEFDINVDLIAGLPFETKESFIDGLLKIIRLSPSNITIHSLYIKRAADYGADASIYSNTNSEVVSEMLHSAYKILELSDYFPYYLYRQKNTIGNHENIGFAKKDKACAYNIYMMDELQTIYGCGANAMTKLVEDGHITRSCGTKYAYNYINKNGEKNK